MKKKMDGLVAVILMVVLFAVGSLTLATKGRELAYAAFVTYTYQLSETPIFANSLVARMNSLTNAININLFGKQFFQDFNTNVQMALGKEMLSYGSQTMVRLKTGQLYDLQPEADASKVQADVDKMAALNSVLSESGIPMLFVYFHTGLYEDDLLPDGVLEYNNETADIIVSGLRGAGIEVLDTRDLYKERGMTLTEAIYTTDQHCAMPMDMAVYETIVQWVNENTSVQLDPSVADVDNFNVETLENAHLGTLGERIGANYITPDNFPIYTPKFETLIHESIALSGGYVEREGTFEEAVLNMDQLELLEENGYGDIYSVYGYHREEVYYTNQNAPESRALVIKDSFGTPVSSLLSLAVRDELAIDLRKTHISAEEYAREYNPDFVVVLHCQEMMRGTMNYVFVD